jgi:hypothetical protein
MISSDSQQFILSLCQDSIYLRVLRCKNGARSVCFAKVFEQSRMQQVGFDVRLESSFGAFDIRRGLGICCDVAELGAVLRWL